VHVAVGIPICVLVPVSMLQTKPNEVLPDFSVGIPICVLVPVSMLQTKPNKVFPNFLAVISSDFPTLY
jgi:hypothetical protein